MFGPILVAMLALGPDASPAQSSPAVDWQPGKCPGPQAIREALSVTGDEWTTACRAAGTDRWLIAALRKPDESNPELPLAIAVTSRTTSVVLQVKLEGEESEAEQIRKLVRRAEEWQIVIAPLGRKPPELRLDVFGTFGDDLFIEQGIATFFRLEGPGLRWLWTALADKLDRRFDSCFLGTRATFRFLSGGRVMRTLTTSRKFRNGGVSIDEAARLRKGCVAHPRVVETFRLKD